MSIPSNSGAAYELELGADSPSEAEKLIQGGVPLDALGLRPLDEAILRVGLDPRTPRTRLAAERLAELPNLNIRDGTSLWLRAGAIRSIVAHSRRVFVTRVHGLPAGERPVVTPNKFEVVGYENGEYSERVAITKLTERGGILIPLASRGSKRVSLDIPEFVCPDGTTLVQEILPWDFQWELYLLAYLPHAMRGVFRTDDFHPPAMSREAPGGLLSLDYEYETASEEGYGKHSTLADRESDPRGDTTAGAALLNVFHSELSPADRRIYLVTTKGNATPKDLADLLAISPDAARMRQKRALERVAKVAETSEALKLLESDFIWQPQGRPGPYGHHRSEPHPNESPEETRQRRLYRRFVAQQREWEIWSPGRLGTLHSLVRAEGRTRARLIFREWTAKKTPAPNSALRRYGEGKSLYKLRQQALGPFHAEASEDGDSYETRVSWPAAGGIVAENPYLEVWDGSADKETDEGASAPPTGAPARAAAHHRECPDHDHNRPSSGAWPVGCSGECWAWYPPGRCVRCRVAAVKHIPRPRRTEATGPAPTREWKPRCLQPDCRNRAAAVYESRPVPPTNTETKPHRLRDPKEKTDANRYCKRHLREREEREVTQAEIMAAGFSRLDSELSTLQEETRRGISSMLTALTWKFPDDEELLSAVDDWRHQIGDIGVRVLADE